jgi:hypothetical protein
MWKAVGVPRGLGVDLDPDAIAEARQGAAGLSAQFEVRAAAAVEGRFDAVINVGSSHARGGFPAALAVLRRLAPVVLYGEGFWRRSPSDAFLAALRGELAANAERHGSPETLAYARRIRERRALPGGTDTLGFALLVLSA